MNVLTGPTHMLRVKVIYTHAVVTVHMHGKASAFWECQAYCMRASSSVVVLWLWRKPSDLINVLGM